MANYAVLNKQNVVKQVITGRDENEAVNGISDWEAHYSEIIGQRCIRTSYNGTIRKNYAGIGYKYDAKLDAFIPPKPYLSWVLIEETCQWKAPIDKPEDDKNYYWDEETISWIESVSKV